MGTLIYWMYICIKYKRFTRVYFFFIYSEGDIKFSILSQINKIGTFYLLAITVERVMDVYNVPIICGTKFNGFSVNIHFNF